MIKISITYAFLVCCLLAAANAGRTQPDKSLDLTQLRRDFVAAVEKDFLVGKDEFKQRSNASGGGTYWLAHLQAKHSGYFVLSYRYNYNNPSYSHVERDFNFRVGSTGCRRGPPQSGSYGRFCVGDTIIVPIAINNFTEHEFSLRVTPYSKEEEATFEKEASELRSPHLDQAAVANPLSGQLRYLGSSSHKQLHRNGGYTLESYATFMAQRPGRFNLALSVAWPNMPPEARPPGLGAAAGVPVIICGRDTPVTLLASRQEVRGYSRGFDGREWVSSTSSDSFMTELIVLQPGDLFSLKYFTSVRSSEFERRERSANDAGEPVPPPLIRKLHFALKPEYDFSEWLVDYLPR